MANYDESEGVWRTVGGRRVFIKSGQSLDDAMRESGKFPSANSRKRVGHIKDDELLDALPDEGYREMIEAIEHYTRDHYDSLSDKEQVEMLNNAIAAADAVHWNDGELYRGLAVDDDFVGSLRVGDVISTGLPSSWSSDAEVAIRFASGETQESPGSARVILVDKTAGSRSAISIRDFSQYMDEEEVLYSGRSSFRVTDKYEQTDPYGNTHTLIDVEEVA